MEGTSERVNNNNMAGTAPWIGVVPAFLFGEFPTDVQQFFKRYLINDTQNDADPVYFVHVISGKDSMLIKIRALERCSVFTLRMDAAPLARQ